MDKQAREARQMAKDLPLKEKIAYIWQYYKWWIIGVTAAVLLIGGTAYEIATRPTYDLEIGCYSQDYISDEKIQALETYFAQFVEDVDGDGEKQVRVYAASTSMAGGSAEGQMAVQTKFMAELSSGAYPVFIFDQAFYETMQSESYSGTMECFRDLSQVPELAEQLGLSQDAPLYWSTRSLYENEENKEERTLRHQQACAVEEAVFGPRQ